MTRVKHDPQYLITYTELKDVVEDEVEANDTLSLDSKTDREKLIFRLLNRITTQAERL